MSPAEKKPVPDESKGFSIKRRLKELLQNEPSPFDQGKGRRGITPPQLRVLTRADEAIAKKAQLEADIARVRKTIATLEGELSNRQLSKKEVSGIKLQILFSRGDLSGLLGNLYDLTNKKK